MYCCTLMTTSIMVYTEDLGSIIMPKISTDPSSYVEMPTTGSGVYLPPGGAKSTHKTTQTQTTTIQTEEGPVTYYRETTGSKDQEGQKSYWHLYNINNQVDSDN